MIFIRHPEADVVYGDAVFVDDSDQFIGYFPIGHFGTSSIEREDFICQPSCFVRRSALAKIGRLNPDLHYIMDWDVWTRLYRAGAKFHYLEQAIVRGENVSGYKNGQQVMGKIQGNRPPCRAKCLPDSGPQIIVGVLLPGLENPRRHRNRACSAADDGVLQPPKKAIQRDQVRVAIEMATVFPGTAMK
jgi:hypothetical protein